MASGNEKDSQTSGHPSTSCTITDDDEPSSENFDVSHMKITNLRGPSNLFEHKAPGIQIKNVIFPKPKEMLLDETKREHMNKEKIDLSSISNTLAECKVNNTVEPARKDSRKFRGDLCNILKIAHSDDNLNDKVVSPMLNKQIVGKNAIIQQRNKLFGMSNPGLTIKPALQKYDSNSELNAAFSNENGDAKLPIQEGEKSSTKFSNKNKAVKFNPEVQVIYCLKKARNDEMFLNTVEILNKETDQQARNHRMRKSYSLVKLNTFLF